MHVKTISIERNNSTWDVGDSRPGDYFGYVVLAGDTQEVKVKIPKHLMDGFITQAAHLSTSLLGAIVQANNPNNVILESLSNKALTHEASDA